MLNVLWFKRDLRIHDHRPLVEASKRGEILPIYIAEPSIWRAPDLSMRHYQFVQESLAVLTGQLNHLGGQLYVAIAEIDDVLQAIYDTYGDFHLFAHEENGTPETFARDLRVHQWMKKRGLPFSEYQGFGVVRGLKSRNDFQKNWEAHMNDDILSAPRQIRLPKRVPAIFSTELATLSHLKLRGRPLKYGQQGGETNAHMWLTSFLSERFKTYNRHISKPLQSRASCSRLSPYLAWGNISIRYVVRQTDEALKSCTHPGRKKQLSAFTARLHWHCHFIQRIEDEPEITTKAINVAFDAVRTEWDEAACQRWFYGKTGIPLVDASMRCLHQTGWINFRSRAMVVSFACNTLMLDWRRPALGLAQLFLDYEPGIHYSQVQMQAGTTGFNTIRVYNPVKMGKDHDPDGAFIRQFIPELTAVPNQYIHEPWLYPAFDTLDYPEPMVDIQTANRHAREVLYSVKRSDSAKTIAQQQFNKHGSRRTKKPKKRQRNTDEQLAFDFSEDASDLR